MKHELMPSYKLCLYSSQNLHKSGVHEILRLPRNIYGFGAKKGSFRPSGFGVSSDSYNWDKRHRFLHW